VAGLGAAAIGLIGCGGGDEGGGETTSGDASGLISKPVDTTSKAKYGGILHRFEANDTAGFDGMRTSNSAAIGHANYTYSRITKYTRAKYPERASGAVEGDAAASWETSGDGLTTTVKVRPNFKYDPRPPTNGRPMTSADIAASWEIYASLNAERDVLANSVDPDAPIIRMETPDANTVVIKSAFPYGPLMNQLGFRKFLQLMPVESDGGFNTKETMRGTGTWRLKSYQPSVGFEYEKNPDWYAAKDVFLDGVKITIIPEYATGLAQFKAGNLWEFSVRQEDIIPTKRDHPKMIMTQADSFDRGTGNHFRFGALPESPFRDERLRQAVSMLIDRELYIETFGNIEQFTKEGLDVAVRWNSLISAGEEAFWLDPHPKSNKLGEFAKYYWYNPAEAKKLVQAAGYTNRPVETDFEWTINSYSDAYRKSAEVMIGMLEAHGDFKFRPLPSDYQTVHITKYHGGAGNYVGMMAGTQGARAELDGWLFGSGKFGTTKTWAPEPDAKFDDMVVAQRKELDPKKRVQIVHDIQRYGAQHMKWLANPGQTLTFSLYQPWMSNKGTFVYFNGGGEIPQENLVSIWYDESQKTA
jgi:peptide/nickel transport system substrate-binding protein